MVEDFGKPDAVDKHYSFPLGPVEEHRTEVPCWRPNERFWKEASFRRPFRTAELVPDVWKGRGHHNDGDIFVATNNALLEN